MEVNIGGDQISRALAILGDAEQSKASTIVAGIDRWGMAGTILAVSCVLSLASVAIASGVHRLTGDPIGWTGLLNTMMIPFILGVPTLILLLSLLRELVRTRAELTRLSMRDVLTGMLNRRCLLELGRCISARSRGGDLGVALIDADLFKQVNDEYGHQLGDETLCCVTRALQAVLPAGSFCGRYGGEEFAIILPGYALEGALELGENMRAAVEQHCAIIADKPIAMTISIGVASDALLDFDALLAQADQALYRAKHQGRNGVVAA